MGLLSAVADTLRCALLNFLPAALTNELATYVGKSTSTVVDSVQRSCISYYLLSTPLILIPITCL
jgi:hypothetical protein